MSKKLNRTAQAARDAFIQRKVDEAVAPWKGMLAHEKLMVGGLKSDLAGAEARLKNSYVYLVCMAIALIVSVCITIKFAESEPSRHPAFITPPKDTPIVVYTENGWHQGYVDTSGNIRSMDNGQKIDNPKAWMKP